ncbi:ribonuclease D [Geomesophilobacter sediminis]|uniref:Ribonuclease D n=1 Tax=Geomesophilobacter sediminis TaxID=2798584 RepID=A0A8J7JJS0_9BACT|nr:HRDC domain-containing protein [Geomesophilobacter sediminis]MBJ6724680.1 ribonuclease D [Geomesophilobacter sediminis]
MQKKIDEHSTASLITNQPSLDRLVERLSNQPVLAFDLEADSLHHYTEKVCLIQVSTEDETWLVDPLAQVDVRLLAPIFADPSVKKVFHGADYDMRSLYRDFGIEVVNLFDTMIASQFLGESEFGLAAQLKKRYGVELDKRFQKADWSKRPFSTEMMEYAAKDTSLLIGLYRQLEGELKAKGRLAWVEEESELVARVRYSSREGEPMVVRFKGASRLKTRELAVLEELLKFRDEKARSADVPPFRVLGNDLLRELAEKQPRSMFELVGVQSLTPKQIDRYGKGILQAIVTGLATPPEKVPQLESSRRPVLDRNVEERVKRLKFWREKKAAQLGLGVGLVANNALLEALAEPGPVKLSLLKRWQHEAFGSEIEELLK